MNKKKRSIFKALQVLLIFVSIIGVIVIATFQFDNRNLTVKFISDEGIYLFERNSKEIALGNCNEIIFPESVKEIHLIKVLVYGKYKSVILHEISYNSFRSYLDSDDQKEVIISKKRAVISQEGTLCLHMNNSFVQKLQELSKSYLQERFIFAGFYICAMVILFLGCNLFEEKQKSNGRNNNGLFNEMRKFVGDIIKYRQYVFYAAQVDLKAEVANSYLNRLWWLLEPMFNMMVYVIVFGNVMGNSVENYATFIYSALLMWSFFSKTVNYSVKLVRNNRDIISKIYIPKFVILITNMILNLYKLAFSLIVLVAMVLIFHVQIGWNIVWVIPAYIVLITLAFGVGTIFLHFGVYIDDLSYAVSILLGMLMFLSGIFYNVMTTLSPPLNSIMMCLNPVAVVVDTMRNALLYNMVSNVPVLAMWFLCSLIMCYVGIHTVYKNENAYVKII